MRCSLVRSNQWLAALSAAALALGLAACGSSDESPSGGASSGSSSSSVVQAGRHHQRRRSDLPGAGLHRVGRALQGLDGHHGQLPGRRLGRRHRPVHRGHRRLRRHRRGDEARGGGGRQEEGRPGPRPDRARRGDRLLQRRRDRQGPQARRRHDRRHLPRQDQEVERPRDRQGQRQHEPARQGHHRLPPLRRVGHDEELHPVPRRLLARVEERSRASTRRSSGRPARAPRATTAWPAASSRPTAPSATSSRPTRCRTTSRPRP